VRSRRPRRSPVKQADVDLWDGLAIAFFEQLVAAADRAHEADPAVPAPTIIGLRSWFRRSSRKTHRGSGGEDGGGGGEGGGGSPGGGEGGAG
jgi:uncharacterized membrane protein YgcG